jgi:hypothetical protein
MTAETGTRFVDWVDYIELRPGSPVRERLASAGYVERQDWARDWPQSKINCWVQPNGVFPMICFHSRPNQEEWEDVSVAIKVDSVVNFAAVNDIFLATDGEAYWPHRCLVIAASDTARFNAIERHGHRGFNPKEFFADKTKGGEGHQRLVLHHIEQFRCRVRDYESEEDSFDYAERHIDDAIKDLGQDLTCDLFFAAEREYWQRRNRAAQFQKARQDRLGLGWANHDHHTYRCSRKYFSRLIGLWEKLGFQLRERFYAGAEAGWGAQICEQPNAGIITFNDVDLSPDELMNDFAHNPLPERNHLGTVGLWCGLHGESFLQAGMHHLECQFDFDSLRQQMESQGGIKVMKPFTDFPYLRQAFTEGERWPVKEEHLAMLLAKGQITAEQAAQFRANGAIGSHLENLERNEGFKGFNQKGVSEIIAKTDPRRNV